MKEDIFENIKGKALKLKNEDIEKALSSIASRFHLDLSQTQSSGATVSASTRRASSLSGIPHKRDISYDESVENADFKLLELIKKDPLSTIYLADQISLKRKVTIKIISEDLKQQEGALDQFIGEAHITGELSHPNIIPVHEAGIDAKGYPFYVMKSMQGHLWNTLLHPANAEDKKKAEKYGLGEHLEILDSVCNAVAFAHSRNVIHRDIKPLNVMIGEFGEVIVMNWGLTVNIGSPDKKSDLTEANAFGGTISYMAPEMAGADADHISKHSDIYLLGAVLYEILTGFPPHEAESAREALADAMRNRIKLPLQKNTINKELMTIALKAMETEPELRFASVLDFQKELRSYSAYEESRILTENAKELLENAQKQNEQIKSLRAIILLEEALQMWQGNNEAKALLEQAEEVNDRLAKNFNSCLLKLIIRGDLYKILVRLITIPVFFLLFLLPFFFYLYILWTTPLYEVGTIRIRQFEGWEGEEKILSSEHTIFNIYFLFDREDLYHIEILDKKIKMKKVVYLKPVDSEENEYYLEERKWIVNRAPYQIFINEHSTETLADDQKHFRVFNPVKLMKVKKSLYNLKEK